jgi:hypothetical protein
MGPSAFTSILDSDPHLTNPKPQKVQIRPAYKVPHLSGSCRLFQNMARYLLFIIKNYVGLVSRVLTVTGTGSVFLQVAFGFFWCADNLFTKTLPIPTS